VDEGAGEYLMYVEVTGALKNCVLKSITIRTTLQILLDPKEEGEMDSRREMYERRNMHIGF